VLHALDSQGVPVPAVLVRQAQAHRVQEAHLVRAVPQAGLGQVLVVPVQVLAAELRVVELLVLVLLVRVVAQVVAVVAQVEERQEPSVRVVAAVSQRPVSQSARNVKSLNKEAMRHRWVVR
jgi:anion-transporting  ArsA/GET3 family ATPase